MVIVLSVFCVWDVKNKEKETIVQVTGQDALEETEALQKDVSLQVENEPELLPEEQSDVKQEEQESVDSEEIIQNEPLKIEVKEDIVPEPIVIEKKDDVSENRTEVKNEEVSEKEELKQDIITQEDVIPEIVTPTLVANEFDLEKLKAYKLPIMIEFGASWCTWCRWMEPTLETLNEEFAGKVVIQSVDVEKFRNEVSDFDVSLLPTIYFFDAEGNVSETRVGAMTRDDILKVFESMGVKK